MITTHVLDTAKGRPAVGVTVILEMRLASEWSPIARGVTDEQGRLAGLTDARAMTPGTYRLTAPSLNLNVETFRLSKGLKNLQSLRRW